MGVSKTFVFSKRQNQVAIVMKALGHPARVAIIDYLVRNNHSTADDIGNELPLSQPTISQHLKQLRTSGVLRGAFKGSRYYYIVDKFVFSKIKQYHDEMAKKMQKLNEIG